MVAAPALQLAGSALARPDVLPLLLGAAALLTAVTAILADARLRALRP